MVIQDSDNEQAEYEVQSVLVIKLVQGKLKYRVDWKEWDEDPK